MVSYGINCQSSCHFKGKDLGEKAVSSANLVLQAMTETGIIPAGHAKLYVASADGDKCRLDGILAGLQEQAKRVKSNGLLIFHFTGHGVIIGDGKNFGLAPMDYDRTMDTCLTVEKVCEYFQDVPYHGSTVLITLDCCHAGGIACEIKSHFDKITGVRQLYVMAACTANEESLMLNSLGYSSFAYFLHKAIVSANLHVDCDQLPIHDIFDECCSCSKALSSLFVTNSNGKLEIRNKVPQLVSAARISTDSGLSTEEKFRPKYNKNYLRVPLAEMCETYLARASVPLSELESKNVLEGCVLVTAMCVMLHSIAVIEVSCSLDNIHNPNLFINAYEKVASSIHCIHSQVDFKDSEFQQGCEFYLHVLSPHIIKKYKTASESEQIIIYDGFMQLNKMRQETEQQASLPVMSQGDDFTDSTTGVNQVGLLPIVYKPLGPSMG